MDLSGRADAAHVLLRAGGGARRRSGSAAEDEEEDGSDSGNKEGGGEYPRAGARGEDKPKDEEDQGCDEGDPNENDRGFDVANHGIARGDGARRPGARARFALHDVRVGR